MLLRLFKWLVWLSQPKFNIGVSAVIFNDLGEVLLLRHRFRFDYPWGTPGGYIHHRETFEQALCREMREELGLIIEVGELVDVFSGYFTKAGLTYRAKIVGGELRLDSREILEARFFPLQHLPETLSPSEHQMLMHMKGVAL